jgi:hypothetical protein
LEETTSFPPASKFKLFAKDEMLSANNSGQRINLASGLSFLILFTVFSAVAQAATMTSEPATYEDNGRQFVVIISTGNKLGKQSEYGDACVAFALPKSGWEMKLGIPMNYSILSGSKTAGSSAIPQTGCMCERPV